MPDGRDEFPPAVKQLLSERAGGRCSNPACRRVTWGPALSPFGRINLGTAAHITAAAQGGPRFDPTLTPEQRRSVTNGIWCCTICARLVDADADRFPKDLLIRWKGEREKEAYQELMNQRPRQEFLRPLACYIEYTLARNLLFGFQAYNPSDEMVIVRSIIPHNADRSIELSWRQDRPVMGGEVWVDGLAVGSDSQAPYNIRPKEEHLFLRYVAGSVAVLQAAPNAVFATIEWGLRRDPSVAENWVLPTSYFERQHGEE